MSQAGQRDWTSYLAPALRLSRVAKGGNGTAALADCATGWSRRRGARSTRLAAADVGPPNRAYPIGHRMICTVGLNCQGRSTKRLILGKSGWPQAAGPGRLVRMGFTTPPHGRDLLL